MTAVYLDHAATTPVRDEVRAAMEPYMAETFGNPSSVHRWGRAAAAALEEARAELAGALGARTSEVLFVRGGTESDNLAVIGGIRALRLPGGPRPVLIVSEIEHSAVLEAARHLTDRGEADLRPIAVDESGSFDVHAALDGLTGRPSLASVMWVNNETGLLMPVHALAEEAAATGTVVHTDASQAVGKVPVRVDETPVQLLTGTGHKLGGPRGCGFLFVRSGTSVEPLHFGGGQERSTRPGTEDVAGAVGLARAVRLAVEDLTVAGPRMAALRDRLAARLSDGVDGLRLNGAAGERAPHVLSVGLPGVRDGAALLMALDLEGLAVSGGSACHSGASGASHVIAALYGADDPLATVRLSVGRGTTEEEIDRAAAVVTEVWRRLAGEVS